MGKENSRDHNRQYELQKRKPGTPEGLYEPAIEALKEGAGLVQCLLEILGCECPGLVNAFANQGPSSNAVRRRGNMKASALEGLATRPAMTPICIAVSIERLMKARSLKEES